MVPELQIADSVAAGSKGFVSYFPASMNSAFPAQIYVSLGYKWVAQAKLSNACDFQAMNIDSDQIY